MTEWQPDLFQQRLLAALGNRTHREVSRAARVSHGTLSKWLQPHGRPNPCIASLWRVAQVLGVSVAWLVGEAESPVVARPAGADSPGAAAHLAVERALAAGVAPDQLLAQLRLLTLAARAR
jgi:transcriptional regulator with XRE-family HTH domain